jgi:hypothetical protein
VTTDINFSLFLFLKKEQLLRSFVVAHFTALSLSQYYGPIASGGSMIGEQRTEKIWNETIVILFKILIRNFLGVTE